MYLSEPPGYPRGHDAGADLARLLGVAGQRLEGLLQPDLRGVVEPTAVLDPRQVVQGQQRGRSPLAHRVHVVGLGRVRQGLA